MRYVVALFAFLFASLSFGAVEYDTSTGLSNLTSSSSSCADMLASYNAAALAAGWADPSAFSCSNDPVIVGARLYVRTRAQPTITRLVEVVTCPTGQHLDVATNTCVNDTVTCPTGQHLDVATNTCVNDTVTCPTGFHLDTSLNVCVLDPVTCATGYHYEESTASCVADRVAVASIACMPSIRTISPCPSGYAPTNATPTGTGTPDPFVSEMDGLPIQDILYAIGVAVCGLLGISVGVKLA